ncbi:hypothetical protein J6590_037861 [Homalodisca vitripennis]|nr:hypothetical protein J6590_037861 [Homalodisca vitripennis]
MADAQVTRGREGKKPPAARFYVARKILLQPINAVAATEWYKKNRVSCRDGNDSITGTTGPATFWPGPEQSWSCFCPPRSLNGERLTRHLRYATITPHRNVQPTSSSRTCGYYPGLYCIADMLCVTPHKERTLRLGVTVPKPLYLSIPVGHACSSFTVPYANCSAETIVPFTTPHTSFTTRL